MRWEIAEYESHTDPQDGALTNSHIYMTRERSVRRPIRVTIVNNDKVNGIFLTKEEIVKLMDACAQALCALEDGL